MRQHRAAVLIQKRSSSYFCFCFVPPEYWKKRRSGCLGYIRGQNPIQLCGDYNIINHDIQIPLKQQVFNGTYPSFLFFSATDLGQGYCGNERGWKMFSTSLKTIELGSKLNSHCFHILGDGHQPNSKVLHTNYPRIPYSRRDEFIPNIRSWLTLAHLKDFHEFDDENLFETKGDVEKCFVFQKRDHQLVKNCWFRLVVWDSRDTPYSNNPFHKGGSLEIQTTGTQTTNFSVVDFSCWPEKKTRKARQKMGMIVRVGPVPGSQPPFWKWGSFWTMIDPY